MGVVDSARFMALEALALNDAIIAVLDAKYHYNFWRPITAIRNGDIDGNPATDREATWQPIATTPMHPEYPCSHCIQSGSVAGVVKAVLGTVDIPEIALTSPTTPGVTHRWTNLTAFTEEVANARIWAGFHYRFSTRVGTDMGLQIGDYVVKNVMQPIVTSSNDERLLRRPSTSGGEHMLVVYCALHSGKAGRKHRQRQYTGEESSRHAEPSGRDAIDRSRWPPSNRQCLRGPTRPHQHGPLT